MSNVPFSCFVEGYQEQNQQGRKDNKRFPRAPVSTCQRHGYAHARVRTPSVCRRRTSPDPLL